MARLYERGADGAAMPFGGGGSGGSGGGSGGGGGGGSGGGSGGSGGGESGESGQVAGTDGVLGGASGFEAGDVNEFSRDFGERARGGARRHGGVLTRDDGAAGRGGSGSGGGVGDDGDGGRGGGGSGSDDGGGGDGGGGDVTVLSLQSHGAIVDDAVVHVDMRVDADDDGADGDGASIGAKSCVLAALRSPCRATCAAKPFFCVQTVLALGRALQTPFLHLNARRLLCFWHVDPSSLVFCTHAHAHVCTHALAHTPAQARARPHCVHAA
eukprot:281035-Pleurochrysis_carterae.AAC.1